MAPMPPLDRPQIAVAVAVECDVVAQATFFASQGEIPALRKAPGLLGDAAMSPGLLRHSDEQTVVGLAALLRAVQDQGLDPGGFGEWAVLAAPRFLGREAFEKAFPLYQNEGAWGVSPHLIPAHSLHSPSGTFSQVLKAHGPNLGIGGTPGGEVEALLLAATLLAEGMIPGVWVILSGQDPAVVDGPPAFEALALALTATSPNQPERPRLRIEPGAVRLLGGPDEARSAVAHWLDPGTLRADPGHDRHPIFRPYLISERSDRPSGLRGPR